MKLTFIKPKILLTPEISKNQLSWRNSPEIYAWTRQNGLISEEDMKKWREKITQDSSIKMFGILTEMQEEIGTCGLTSLSQTHGSAEFSLFIDPAYHRRGLGQAALEELFRYGFKHLRLHCIWGETFEHNPALKLFLSLGMKVDGKLRERYFKSGSYTDAFTVSILKEEAKVQPWWS